MASGVVTVLALALVGVACSGSDGATTPETTVQDTLAPTTSTTARTRVTGPLRIGVILPITGPAAAFGPPLLAGVQLAVKEIDAAGGVNDDPIALLQPRDEGKEPDAALELIRDGAVDAIIGPASSSNALKIAETVNQANVVSCSPTAGSIALTKYGNRYVMRTMPSDALEGAALARALSQSGFGSAAVAYPDDGYGQAIYGQLQSSLDTTVVKLKAAAYDSNAGPDNLQAVAGRLLTDDPRMVVVIGLPEAGGRMLSELRELDTGRVNRWFVSSAMREPNLFEKVAPGRADGLQDVEGVSPQADPGRQRFTEALRTVAPDVSSTYAAYAYDCVNLIALAAQVTKSNDPRTFRDALVDVSRAGNPCTSFAACAENVKRDTPLNFDYEGTSGPVDLADTLDVISGRYELFRFDASGRDVDKNITLVAP